MADEVSYLDQALFGFYPYVCLSLFVLGTLFRFEREPHTWQASSSQMMGNRHFAWASNLFHVGVLGLLGGHVAGLLVPPELNHMAGLSESAHQHVELVMGGACALMTFVGLSALLWRRVLDARVRATSSAGDLAIALLLWATLVAGMATLPHSFATRHTGEYLGALSGWAQRVVTFRGGAVESLAGVPWAFKLHMLFGMTVFLVFPFTRLVHVCSAPLGYLVRGYTQIVRSARRGA